MRFFNYCLLTILCSASLCQAGDWTQILGPYRNGHAAGETLDSAWPETGPPVKWQRGVGSGYAGISVYKKTAILFHRVGDLETVEALDTQTGEPLWKQTTPINYKGSFNPNDGPIAVPLIHKNRIYTFGIAGNLQCLDLETGKKIWSRDTHKDFQVGQGYFGVGSTPIIVEDRLLVNVGGKRKNAGIVAFSLDKGFTLWQTMQDDASYSSPTSAFLHGRFYAIFITRQHLVGIDPQNGNILFQFPFGKRGPTVNGADPVVIGNYVFATASYGVGGFWGKIDRTNASEVWRNQQIMSSQYTTPIEYGGKLIGIDGRQDIGTSRLICFDPQTQKVNWSEDNFGYATLFEADNKLIMMKTDGTLVLAEASLEAYKELGRASIFNSTTRALPALSNGLLFVRDQKTLKCLQLKSEIPAPVTTEKSPLK
ncbi:PQQ-binding-like beta-propeller repeat protein [uncultured Gimesia sp.]|uniref:PQQ-binding-like beta-propeller repeat protein n=1 Tax=uncultured Gimesia sp. TaxID=1678688 RepID=UPI0030DA264E|tara:strand:+ start:18073 stop:19344 length:1272 start_codon:yes stop_codon:yes gene_type:complete